MNIPGFSEVISLELKESELKNLSANWKEQFSTGRKIGLSGPLGAGKTTFVRELVKELGFDEEVTSPTYVLQHIYENDNKTIQHWDLYRVASPPLELFEEDSNCMLTLIEWPEKSEAVLKVLDAIVQFEIVDQETRKLNLLFPNNSSNKVAQ